MRPVRFAPMDARVVAAVPVPVEACPRCGSLGIRPATLAEGVNALTGPLTLQACPECGFQGQPVTFPTREAYAAHLRALGRLAP